MKSAQCLFFLIVSYFGEKSFNFSCYYNIAARCWYKCNESAFCEDDDYLLNTMPWEAFHEKAHQACSKCICKRMHSLKCLLKAGHCWWKRKCLLSAERRNMPYAAISISTQKASGKSGSGDWRVIICYRNCMVIKRDMKRVWIGKWQAFNGQAWMTLSEWAFWFSGKSRLVCKCKWFVER